MEAIKSNAVVRSSLAALCICGAWLANPAWGDEVAPTPRPVQPQQYQIDPSVHAATHSFESSTNVVKAVDRPLAAPNRADSKASGNGALGAIASLVFSLAVVLGLFFLVAWLMRRGMPTASRSLPAEVVEVLGRAPLAGRQQMHVVRFANKLLLVSVSPDRTETLAELVDPQEIKRVSSLCEADAPQAAMPAVEQFIRKIGRRSAALLLATTMSLCIPAASWAQSPTLAAPPPVAEPMPTQVETTGAESNADRANTAARVAPSQSLPENLDAGRWTSPEGLPTTLKTLLAVSALSLAPALVMMTTCFVRIVIVLGLLRQALGTQQLPPNQVMTAVALFLTLLVMWPTWKQTYDDAVVPYTNHQITGEEAWQRGSSPIRDFMAAQIERTGNSEDVWLFYRYLPAGTPEPKNYGDVPIVALAPAFLLSELKTAFLIGLQIYLPFVVIDLVVSSITIAMGMLMLPPAMISLPFKLLLFVLVDGWHLVVEMLLSSFQLAV